MSEPFRLVPDSLSHDSLEALEALYGEAKDGKLIGISFAAIYKGKTYIVNAAGECRRSPTFSMGMVCMLLDELRSLERPKNNQ